MRKILAPALALLLLAGSAPLVAHANNPVTPAPRFASYEVFGTNNSEASITTPAGYPNASVVKSPTSTDTKEQLKVDTLSTDIKGPFRDRFTEGGLSNASSKTFLFLPGTQSTTTPSTITITFDSPTPAGLVGFNIQDIDYEVVYMKMVAADGTTPLTFEQCGFQSVYNSQTGGSSTRPDYTPDPNQAELPDACVLISDRPANTDGASIWFVPTVPITQIVLKETAVAAGSFGWFAADRPQPTITAKPSVPTNFTIGENPITITPDMFDITWPDHVLSEQFTPTGDFDDTIGVQFRVKDDGGTGCTLESNSPLTFSATTPGTCIIECFQPERPNFLPATIDIPITVTTAQTPSPAHTSRPARTPEAVPNRSGPELAATGAPAWPLWAGVAVMGGGIVVLWSLRRKSRINA